MRLETKDKAAISELTTNIVRDLSKLQSILLENHEQELTEKAYQIELRVMEFDKEMKLK